MINFESEKERRNWTDTAMMVACGLAMRPDYCPADISAAASEAADGLLAYQRERDKYTEKAAPPPPAHLEDEEIEAIDEEAIKERAMTSESKARMATGSPKELGDIFVRIINEVATGIRHNRYFDLMLWSHNRNSFYEMDLKEMQGEDARTKYEYGGQMLRLSHSNKERISAFFASFVSDVVQPNMTHFYRIKAYKDTIEGHYCVEIRPNWKEEENCDEKREEE